MLDLFKFLASFDLIKSLDFDLIGNKENFALWLEDGFNFNWLLEFSLISPELLSPLTKLISIEILFLFFLGDEEFEVDAEVEVEVEVELEVEVEVEFEVEVKFEVKVEFELEVDVDVKIEVALDIDAEAEDEAVVKFEDEVEVGINTVLVIFETPDFIVLITAVCGPIDTLTKGFKRLELVTNWSK